MNTLINFGQLAMHAGHELEIDALGDPKVSAESTLVCLTCPGQPVLISYRTDDPREMIREEKRDAILLRVGSCVQAGMEYGEMEKLLDKAGEELEALGYDEFGEEPLWEIAFSDFKQPLPPHSDTGTFGNDLRKAVLDAIAGTGITFDEITEAPNDSTGWGSDILLAVRGPKAEIAQLFADLRSAYQVDGLATQCKVECPDLDFSDDLATIEKEGDRS